MAIADTFDAITVSRRYRRGQGTTAAAGRIAEGRGTKFDPELTDLFLFPPAFRRVEAAMRESMQRRERPARERRHGESESDAPDVTFRWRDSALAPPP